jgi:hypothetical protein
MRPPSPDTGISNASRGCAGAWARCRLGGVGADGGVWSRGSRRRRQTYSLACLMRNGDGNETTKSRDPRPRQRNQCRHRWRQRSTDGRYGCSKDVVQAALNKFALEMSQPAHRATTLALAVARLEMLETHFTRLAIAHSDAQAGTLVSKLIRTKSELLGRACADLLRWELRRRSRPRTQVRRADVR